MYVVAPRQTMGQYLPRPLLLGQHRGGTARRAADTAAIIAAEAVGGPAAGALVALVQSAGIPTGILDFFGPDPRNVPDTQLTEAMEIVLNQLWFKVSGEQLPTSCDPGRCGAQRVAIFQPSAYPNVPNGSTGDPNVDIDQAIAQANALISDSRQRLLRPASRSNPAFTQNPILLLLNRVRDARLNPATAATAVLPASSAAVAALPTWLWWVGGGLLAWKLLS